MRRSGMHQYIIKNYHHIHEERTKPRNGSCLREKAMTEIQWVKFTNNEDLRRSIYNYGRISYSNTDDLDLLEGKTCCITVTEIRST